VSAINKRIGNICISKFPVTYLEFAIFLQSEEYYENKHWNIAKPQDNGDVILERINFQWSERHSPVVNINWYEAQAYCKYKGGRLPWMDELINLFNNGKTISNNFSEWCNDWYHPSCLRPNVPAYPARRRVYGSITCLVPDEFRKFIGFRVYYE